MHTLSPARFITTAQHTAQHFGFIPYESLERPAERYEGPRATRSTAASRKLDGAGGLIAAGVCGCLERSFYGGKPLLFFNTATQARTGETTISLSVVGVEKSIAEALLIQTLRSLLRDLGYARSSVRVNSLGDNDSAARYARELTAFFRKRLDEMPPTARELMKEDVIATLEHLIETGHELAQRSPSPLEYLTDASRRHFREVVEHLDMTETPYEIDPRLIASTRCYADALFAIDLLDEATGAPLADAPLSVRGGRITSLSRDALKVDIPAAGAAVTFRGKRAPARIPRPKSVGTPSVFMVQLGFGPKIRSLMLLSALKEAGIAAHQALASDSLSEQLRLAEHYNVPYSVILGQKEFVERSVILRDMRSRSQESVPFDELIPYLKKVVPA